MNKERSFSIMLVIMFVAMLGMCLTGTVQAQPDPCDPDLRLWLKADDLAGVVIPDGNSVLSWTDASSYGTIFAPRTPDEAPTYEQVNIYDTTISTVEFKILGPILRCFE